MRIVVLAVFLVVFAVGCGNEQAQQPEETTVEETVIETIEETVEVTQEQAAEDVPLQDYRVVEQAERPIEGSEFTQATYLIYATHNRDLQRIADKLRGEGGHDMVALEAINGPGGELVGRAYSYASPEVEQAAMAEIEQIGDEIGDEMIREQCASWTEEDTELLGPPPPEWNCEQF